MSHGPSTLGTMITSSLSPISLTSSTMSSSTHGLSSELTRVHSAQSPKSNSLAALMSPSRAASFLSAGMASSRLPRRMSACLARSGAFAAMFSFEKSRKWIIREGFTGISSGGSGAPIASGCVNWRGFRTEFPPVDGREIYRSVAFERRHGGLRSVDEVDGTDGIPKDVKQTLKQHGSVQTLDPREPLACGAWTI